MVVNGVYCKPGCKYLVFSEGRGEISQHISMRSAEESVYRDLIRCKAAKINFDVEIYQFVGDDRWEVVEEKK